MKKSKKSTVSNNDITSSEIGCNIAHDVTDAINDRINGEQYGIEKYTHLEDCVKHNPHFNKLYTTIKNKEFEKYSTQKDQNDDIFINKLLNYKKEHDKKVKRNKLITFYTSLAAAVVLIFTIVEYYPSGNITELEATKISEPILTLSNGTQINLNDNLNDISQNGFVIDANGKQLKYNDSNSGKDAKEELNSVIVPANHTYRVILSDSSVVVLNANSKLTFPATFKNAERVVELEGEGYFQVKKSKKQFLVKTNGAYVRVYGTTFNVNARDSSRIKTTLVEGVVGVGAGDIEEQILKPNQMSTINLISKKCKIETVEVNDQIGWQFGLIRCINSNIEDLIKDISNWYGIDIRYNREETRNVIVNISIKHTMPMAEALSFIEDVLNVKFINKGRFYVIEID